MNLGEIQYLRRHYNTIAYTPHAEYQSFCCDYIHSLASSISVYKAQEWNGYNFYQKQAASSTDQGTSALNSSYKQDNQVFAYLEYLNDLATVSHDW